MGILRDKKFIKTMLTLAIPITIQSFITSSLNLVDNLMIGKLGEEAIAAVGLANQYFFIFMLCLSGINAGASVFMSQYWGKRDVKSIKKVELHCHTDQPRGLFPLETRALREKLASGVHVRRPSASPGVTCGPAALQVSRPESWPVTSSAIRQET